MTHGSNAWSVQKARTRESNGDDDSSKLRQSLRRTRTSLRLARVGLEEGTAHADIVRDWRYATRGGQPWPLYEGGPRGGVGVTRVGGDGGL